MTVLSFSTPPQQMKAIQVFNIIKSQTSMQLKHANSNKELKINSDLRRAINDLTSRTPELDQEKMIDTIVSEKMVRMTKESIKTGVEAFFAARNNGKVEEPEKVRPIVDLEVYQQKPTKKKKNQFVVEFQDHESYRFKNLGGVKDIFEKINSELFSLIEKEALYKSVSRVSPNRGFLLCGSPGSGKTFLANCILSYLSKLQSKKLNAFSVNSLDFLSGDSEQKLKKLFQTAQEKVPSIIFIDNLEQLCNKDNNKRMQSLPALTLYNYINKIKDKEIYVLGATSAAEKMDALTKPGMFYKQIKVNNPDETQRREIIEKVIAMYNHELKDNLKELALLTAGYVAVDIVCLFKEAAVRCVDRVSRKVQATEEKTETAPETLITLQDVRDAFMEIQPILKKDGFAKIPTVKLEDVGALESIKLQLIQQIILPMKQRQKFTDMNFQVNGGGILLYGPPGCGKTMIAKAIANEANANFITVKGPELLTKYVGESEEAVRKVFERARQSSPCIIFFDQFDALAPKRQDQGNQVTERVVNTLLNELSGVDDRRMVYVIAATNRPDIIDEAILRSGRIEKHLYVPLPNHRQRHEILKKITSKVKREQSLQLEEISQRTQNFSGADLHFLVKKAIITAVASDRSIIDANDMKKALQTYKKDKYNKNNRLKLSQFEEEEQNQDIDLLDNGPNDFKKTKSTMEVQTNEPNRPKASKNDSLLNTFIEHLLKLNRQTADKTQP